MGIEATYKDIELQKQILALLEAGEIPSYTEIENLLVDLDTNYDFSKPQFKAVDHKIDETSYEESSVSKYAAMITAVYKDLKVLYDELKLLTEQTINLQERWEVELRSIENSAMHLEDRVGNLTLLAQDTEGYVSFILENFKDTSKIDKLNTFNLAVNPATHTISLAPSSRSYQAIALNLKPTDVSFKVSSRNAGTQRQVQKSDIMYAFKDEAQYWHTQLLTNSVGTAVGELKVHLSDTPIAFSRIEIFTNVANKTSALQITPMYSVDGYLYQQLPGNLVTQSIVDVGIFVFETIEATDVKFIFTKTSWDDKDGNQYVYEFGAKHIQFFNEAFNVTPADLPTLITTPLSVLDSSDNPIEFSKLTLESCENVPDETDINYYITVSNDETVPIDTDTYWISVDPKGRIDKKSSSVIDVGDLTWITIGDSDEAVSISYNPSTSDNPDDNFYLVGLNGGSIETSPSLTTASETRYSFINSNDRILNFQLKYPKFSSVITEDPTSGYFLIDLNSLELWRNVGEQGLDLSDAKVRGLQRGWGFTDPYYTSVVFIGNIDGIDLNVGDTYIWIDDIKLNKIVHLSYGTHNVKVHKNSWYHVTPDYNTLAELIAADPLYPYNHKYLIEGYSYGTSFDEQNEMIYTGVDIFAEYKPDRISVFDLINNIESTNYNKYAIDYDLPNSYVNTYSNTVFLLKVDENKSDNINEKFIIKFRMIDLKYKYLRLKAEFKTTNASLTPVLDGYKIKLG